VMPERRRETTHSRHMFLRAVKGQRRAIWERSNTAG
jgi:hypothetical protein